ncbi:MAG: hypothetical protein HY303_03865 [Candidatus Wallbacteria bacterium]|nr:hypothetical protein [Candidatus Wallbacteria bacterium]
MSGFIRTTALVLAALALVVSQPAAVAQQEDVIEGQTAIHAPNIPPSDYYLPRNRLIEIELLEPIDTQTAKRNQVFHYRVPQDIKGDGGTVIRHGTEGQGFVLESRKGTKRDTARLHLNFGEVPSVEGRPVKLGFSEAARKANETLAGLTPVIGGYFEAAEGKRARLAAGTRLLASVEFPYGTRRIKAGEDGAKYRLFSDEPVQQR